MKSDRQATTAAAAAIVAKQLVADTLLSTQKETAELLSQTIKDFFKEGEDQKRFIDVNRIPFICKDIADIKQKLEQVTTKIYIGIGILTAVSILLNYVLK